MFLRGEGVGTTPKARASRVAAHGRVAKLTAVSIFVGKLADFRDSDVKIVKNRLGSV